jgi:hypothetical protein
LRDEGDSERSSDQIRERGGHAGCGGSPSRSASGTRPRAIAP